MLLGLRRCSVHCYHLERARRTHSALFGSFRFSLNTCQLTQNRLSCVQSLLTQKPAPHSNPQPKSCIPRVSSTRSGCGAAHRQTSCCLRTDPYTKLVSFPRFLLFPIDYSLLQPRSAPENATPRQKPRAVPLVEILFFQDFQETPSV